MISNNSNNKKFFEDRSGTSITPGLVYSNTLGEYVTADMPATNITTSATQRLGIVNTVNDNHTAKTLEDVGYPSGTNIGSVTVFIGEQQNAKDLIDFFRTGRNIKNVEHYARATTTRPMIRVSPVEFFEDETLGNIDHSLNFNAFGQGYLFLDVDESLFNQRIIPFQDFSKLIPKDLVGKRYVSSYPIVHDTRKNYSQFVEPDDEKINGAIDVFSVRRSLANTSINDILVKGIRASISAGGIDSSRKGSTIISNTREYGQHTEVDYFEDAQDVELTIPVPGYVSQGRYNQTIFEDKKRREIRTQYSFLTDLHKDSLLVNSDKNISEIGTRFKSETCGLIFGESNELGTDSIAFGGLKK